MLRLVMCLEETVAEKKLDAKTKLSRRRLSHGSAQFQRSGVYQMYSVYADWLIEY